MPVDDRDLNDVAQDPEAHNATPSSECAVTPSTLGRELEDDDDDGLAHASAFPADLVENGTIPTGARSNVDDTLMNTSELSSSVDASSLLGNTMDDISSLGTLDGTVSPMQNENGIESDIGQVEVKVAPGSLAELPEVNGHAAEETGDHDDDDGWVDVIGSGDLMKRVTCKGKGLETRPQRGDVVTINIAGKLEDGQAVEVEERKRLTVGDAEVIQGIDLAIPLMEVDEVAEVVVRPRLAYGKHGKEPDVPPNATVTYTIEMLSVEAEPEVIAMSYSDRADIGNRKRERGNFWFSRGEYSCALQCYRRALEFLDEEGLKSKELTGDVKELLENRIKVYNNMAAAQLKIGAFDAALQSVNNVLKVQPENVKAIFRKGKILDSMGQTVDAIATLKRALQLEPESKIIHQELSKLATKQKSEVKTEREMYRRMLGQDKQASSAPSHTAASGFLKWGVIAGGLTVAVLSIVAYRHFHGPAGMM